MFSGEAEIDTQRWLCRRIVEAMRQMRRDATVIIVRRLAPELVSGDERVIEMLSFSPAIEREFAEEVLHRVLSRWQEWGSAEITPLGSFQLTAAGIIFAHQQVILDELRRIREAKPSLT